jgi:hypothetical protein
MKKNYKNKDLKSKALAVLLGLTALAAGAKEVEGEILFNPSHGHKPSIYSSGFYLDIDDDRNPDVHMTLNRHFNESDDHDIQLDRLESYLVRGAKIVYEDEGLEGRDFNAADRMVGFRASNGVYVGLEQIIDAKACKRYFPFYWAKLVRQGLARD